ncbi:MAG TPA: serine/threonine-protein kinase, partial [Polyangiaceae bacterium]|nr:serine/threonine-protein kinase [Polyangiaceae bacterium]
MSSASLRIDAGVRVGPYLVERRLGQTAIGTVYVARHASGERVVLRVVQRDAATSAIRARLKREARAFANVDHPGLERVHGIGEQEGMFWVALGFVRGTPLERLLAERGPLSIDAALRHTVQVAEALGAAHDAGVLHREIAPSKLLLTPDGGIVLVGFGIAPRGDRTMQASAGDLSAYAAPEQIEHGLADERSDLWAVGCVLYEMVVGAPPFGRGGGGATAAAILRDEPAFPTHVPSAIVHIVNACVRKNSFARIAASRELLALLRDAVGDPRCRPGSVSERPSSRSSVPSALLHSGTIPPPPRLPSMPFRPSSGRG